MTIETILDEIRQLRDEMSELALIDNPTAAQEARFSELTERFEVLNARREALNERNAKVEAVRDAAAKYGTIPGSAPDDKRTGPVYMTRSNPFGPVTGRESDEELRGRALAAAEQTPADDSLREAMTRTVERSDVDVAAHVIATADPDYYTAWRSVMKNPTSGFYTFTDAERAAYRRVEEMRTTLALSGIVVPASLDPSVVLTNDGTVNPLRGIARTVQTTQNSWRGITSAGVTASYDAEATEVSDDTPAMAELEIVTAKAQAFAALTIEAFDQPMVSEEIARMIADARDRLEATAFLTGSGSDAPEGLLTALDGTAAEINPDTPETFAASDVYKIQNTLAPRWQSGAVWIAELSTINHISQFESSNGARLHQQIDGANPTLLRKRLVEASDMPAYSAINAAADADNFIVVYGDPRELVIVDRVGLTIEPIPHLFNTNANRPDGRRGVYAYWRSGSGISTAGAFVLFNVATSSS